MLILLTISQYYTNKKQPYTSLKITRLYLTMLARITRFPVVSVAPRVATTLGARHMSSLGETFDKKVCCLSWGWGEGGGAGRGG
jgi:hypothetical protein